MNNRGQPQDNIHDPDLPTRFGGMIDDFSYEFKRHDNTFARSFLSSIAGRALYGDRNGATSGYDLSAYDTVGDFLDERLRDPIATDAVAGFVARTVREVSQHHVARLFSAWADRRFVSRCKILNCTQCKSHRLQFLALIANIGLTEAALVKRYDLLQFRPFVEEYRTAREAQLGLHFISVLEAGMGDVLSRYSPVLFVPAVE
ncbi:MAG TPA: hypothetical protein VGN11_02195 [Candidatus Baltobacteraceae bacterium]|nr:hypothetical protein [Candidatus Baltobacteraceae bacterium]